MANKKTKRSKKPGPNRNKQARRGSSTRASITLLVAGVAGAVTIALYLSSGSANPAAGLLDDPTSAEGLAGGHIRGPENAGVTLVEFGDYECPTCADFHHIIADMMRRMPDSLELEFHHFPLPVGPNSVTASLAAEAAALQDRFWEMNDALFETQSQWSGRDDAVELFISMAEQLGLDTERFVQDMKDAGVQSRVVRDREQGAVLGVSATPAFFVNGRRLEGLPQTITEFDAIIRSAMPE
jgi:protein-disulfide isomerase